jgi:hypothetical protein
MAHLADIDSGIRTFGKIAAVFAAAVVVLFLVIIGGQFMKNLLFPTPPPPPTEKFGILPPLDFPAQDAKTLSFNVNTLTGTLPDLGDRMNVYKVKKPTASLVALATTRNLLEGAGFDENEIKISESVYQWSNEDNVTIQFDLSNNNFKISSDLLTSPPTELSGIAATKDGAFEAATGFLQTMGQDIKDLDPEKTLIKYLKVTDGVLTQAQSQDEAQYIRIDLFQKDINKHPVYFPGNNESIMHFIFKSEGFNPLVVEGEYSNPDPDANSSSDYPIITAEEALEKLKGKQALIFYDGKSETVDITSVDLGYYITPDQDYFMPVVVFKGKNFLGLVNAVAQ